MKGLVVEGHVFDVRKVGVGCRGKPLRKRCGFVGVGGSRVLVLPSGYGGQVRVRGGCMAAFSRPFGDFPESSGVFSCLLECFAPRPPASFRALRADWRASRLAEVRAGRYRSWVCLTSRVVRAVSGFCHGFLRPLKEAGVGTQRRLSLGRC